MKLYMKVTKDKYQLPLAVAASPQELADLTGYKSKDTILTAISHAKKAKYPGWVRIESPDYEEPEEARKQYGGRPRRKCVATKDESRIVFESMTECSTFFGFGPSWAHGKLSHVPGNRFEYDGWMIEAELP